MGIEETTTKIADIETLENKHKESKYVCKHEFPELTAVCPVTRLPDFYNMKLEYEPDERLVELKSFKLFLNSFRENEILHEEITNEIVNRLIHSINPRWIKIEIQVRVRGGIETTIKRHWDKENGDLITTD